MTNRSVVLTIGAASVVSLLVVLVTRIHASRERSTAPTESLRASTELATVWAIGAILWPAVFHMFVGLDTVQSVPLLMIALIWPIVLLVHDLSSIHHQTMENEVRRSRQGMQLETNAVSSLTFAIGGLLMTHMGRRWAESAVPLLSGVVFLCIAFITPQLALQAHSIENIRVNAMQRVALVYCIGLLSATVLLIMQVMGRRTSTHARQWKVAAEP